MRLISASRRTDIPAFYSQWFMERVRAGWCEWANPFNGRPVRVSLRPEDVLGIVFWSRFPMPMLVHLNELSSRGYPFYFHVTLNGYERTLEPRNPDAGRAIDALRRLSDAISPARTFWRYDPIILSDATPAASHIRRFERIAAAISGYSARCYFSFVDLYKKTARNLVKAGVSAVDPDLQSKRQLIRELARIAHDYNITLYACCEDALVVPDLVAKAHCVDLEPLGVSTHLKAAPTRAECGCVESVDIGAYDTCLFGCAYCYATNSWQAARTRALRHDSRGSMLIQPRVSSLT